MQPKCTSQKTLTLCILIALFLFSSSTNLNKKTNSKQITENNDLTNCESVTVSGTEITCRFLYNNGLTIKSLTLELNDCFKADDGKIIFSKKSEDTHTQRKTLQVQCSTLSLLVSKVKYYDKNGWGKTVTKEKDLTDKYYMNGFCLKDNGKKGWWYINVYSYIRIHDLGINSKLSCEDS